MTLAVRKDDPYDLPAPRLKHAIALQKKGLTMTEIAAQMGIGRAVIEEVLYWREARREWSRG